MLATAQRKDSSHSGLPSTAYTHLRPCGGAAVAMAPAPGSLLPEGRPSAEADRTAAARDLLLGCWRRGQHVLGSDNPGQSGNLTATVQGWATTPCRCAAALMAAPGGLHPVSSEAGSNLDCRDQSGSAQIA